MPKNMSEDELRYIARQHTINTGESVTPEEIAAIAANFDEDAVVAEERKRYETKLWDKKSDINGVKAQDILLARDDIPEGGEVYLVIDKHSGDVVYFQPFLPGDEGAKKITKSNWESASSKHLDEISAANASQKFMTDLPAQLNDIRNPKKNKG